MTMEENPKIKKGTIRVNTMDEFNKIAESFDWQVVSPGGAAGMLHVSRAYIHQLEKNERIRAYRLDVNFDKTGLPKIIQLLITPPKYRDFILIPIVDLDDYQREMKMKSDKKKK